MGKEATGTPDAASKGPGRGLQAVAVVILAVLVLGGGLVVRQAATALSGIQCYNNVEELAICLQMYAQEHGSFPPAGSWCDELVAGGYEEHPEVFRCPRGGGARSSYALNDALSGVDPGTIDHPEHTVLVFESDGGWNAHGGRSTLVTRPRHNGGDYYGFAGGQMNSADPEARWASRREGIDGSDRLWWEPLKRRRPQAPSP